MTTAPTVSPSNLQEFQDAIAKRKTKSVRVAAYGHSWSPITISIEDQDTTLILTKQLKRFLSEPDDVRKKLNGTFETGVSIKVCCLFCNYISNKHHLIGTE